MLSGNQEDLARGLVAEYLSGAGVEFIFDPLDVGVGQRREVCESRSRKSEQRDKWSFCLTASKISPRIRRDDEQETTPESHTKLQGQGGACRHQGRDDAFTACGAF